MERLHSVFGKIGSGYFDCKNGEEETNGETRSGLIWVDRGVCMGNSSFDGDSGADSSERSGGNNAMDTKVQVQYDGTKPSSRRKFRVINNWSLTTVPLQPWKVLRYLPWIDSSS